MQAVEKVLLQTPIDSTQMASAIVNLALLIHSFASTHGSKSQE